MKKIENNFYILMRVEAKPKNKKNKLRNKNKLKYKNILQVVLNSLNIQMKKKEKLRFQKNY